MGDRKKRTGIYQSSSIARTDPCFPAGNKKHQVSPASLDDVISSYPAEIYCFM